MEEKKADYVAVHTTDNVSPPLTSAPPYSPSPAPFNHCYVNGQQPRRRRCRLVKYTLIGAAISLLAFSNFGFSNNDSKSTISPLQANSGRSTVEFGYPSELPGSAQMKEMDDFFSELKLSVGPNHRPHFAPECCAQPDGPGPFNHDNREHGDDNDINKKHDHHRHRHHRHGGKHHRHHDDDDDNDEDGKTFDHRQHTDDAPEHGHHRHHRYGDKHHGKKSENGHYKKPKGCPCFAPPPPLPGAEVQFSPAGAHLGDGEHTGFPPPPPSFCPPEIELNATSSAFKFSPEDFGRAALFIGDGFADSGDVVLTKSVSEDLDTVSVNVTVLHGSDFILEKVNVNAFDHEGQFVVELRHDHRHHRPFPHPPPPPFRNTPGDLCLKYIVNVAFPSNVDTFEEFKLRAKQAKVTGDKSISGVNFEKFFAGIGRGYLNIDGLHAQSAKLGVLSGHIRGTFESSQTFSAGVVRGSAEFKVVPSDEAVKISVAVGKGLNSIEIPADAYQGDFSVHSLHEGSPSVSAPNPVDVHVVKYNRNVMAGYYKEEDTGSMVAIHNKHGDSKLAFV